LSRGMLLPLRYRGLPRAWRPYRAARVRDRDGAAWGV